MKLGDIFQAAPVWSSVAKLKLAPRTAYQVLKYVKKVSAEFEIVEQQRVALIRKITNTVDGQDAKIEPNTEEFRQYAEQLQAVMETESDLPKINMTMDKFVEEIDGRTGDDNEISAKDLAILEVFFEVTTDG